MDKYALGLDYGTNTCRAVIINLKNGEEIATDVFPYPTGKDGIVIDPKDPNMARQHPADYIKGCTAVVTGAIKKAKKKKETTPEKAPAPTVEQTLLTEIRDLLKSK